MRLWTRLRGPRGSRSSRRRRARAACDRRSRSAGPGRGDRRAGPNRAPAGRARRSGGGPRTTPTPRVRRRAAEVAPKLGRSAPCALLVELLARRRRLGRRSRRVRVRRTPAPDAAPRSPRWSSAATAHADPLVREAAVAALGAQGDPATLPAVLAACDDKPAIRRRAVLALAAFEGDEVEARLQSRARATPTGRSARPPRTSSHHPDDPEWPLTSPITQSRAAATP